MALHSFPELEALNQSRTIVKAFSAESLCYNTRSNVIIGIDLAGSLRHPSGLGVLRDMKEDTEVAYADQVLRTVEQAKLDLA